MNREHKLALVVGFTLILFVGILLSDHLAAGSRAAEQLPVASNTDWVLPDSLEPRSNVRLAAPAVTKPTPTRTPAATPDRRVAVQASNSAIPSDGPIVSYGPRGEPVTQGRMLDQAPAPSPAEPPAPRAPSRTFHVIASGETLQDISQAHFGTTRRWQEIARLNNITNPDRVRVGQKLRIPGEETSRAAARPSRTRATSHTVSAGETLIAIARRELGSGDRWEDIARANDINDPGSIRVGQILVIPNN